MEYGINYRRKGGVVEMLLALGFGAPVFFCGQHKTQGRRLDAQSPRIGSLKHEDMPKYEEVVPLDKR